MNDDEAAERLEREQALFHKLQADGLSDAAARNRAAEIVRLVDAAPPLTDDQRTRLAILLKPEPPERPAAPERPDATERPERPDDTR